MDISLYRMIPPDLHNTVFVNSVQLMNVISHEIEDVVINNDLQIDFYAGFQRFSFFTRQLNRYKRLASICRRVYVWGIPDITPPPISGVEYIPLTPTMDLAREWFLIVDSPDFFTALLTQEQTYGQDLPKDQRRFKGIWTYDPDLVARGYLLISQVLGQNFRPVLQRNYQAQNRYLIQISNRLVQRQDAIDTALNRNTLIQSGLVHSETPLLIVDAAQAVVAASSSASDLLQIAPDTIIGQPLHQCCNGIFADLRLGDNEASLMTSLPSIRDVPLVASYNTVHNKQADPLGWIVTLHTSEAVREQARQQRSVVLPIAPMLNKYLSGIQQLLTMMPSLASRQDVQLRVVSQMQRMVGEMNSQVHRLSLLQELEEQTNVDAENIQIVSLAQQVVEELRSRSGESKVINLDVAPAIPLLQCNSDQIKLALRELLDNALHHSQHGGSVNLRIDRQNGCVRIIVQDDGHGISPDHLDRIFEPFYHTNGFTNTAHNDTPTRLGLALARAVARAHNGQITVESAVGQGSTFTLTLPIVGK